jgi:hypothetical protein
MSLIKEGAVYLDFFASEINKIKQARKVIAQQDQIDFSFLSEEEQKRIGWFDVEELAKSANGYLPYARDTKGISFDEGYKEGFQKAQELLSDRRFTLEDILDAWELGAKEGLPLTRKKKKELIQSLSKQSWNVEIEFIGNKVKILKLL